MKMHKGKIYLLSNICWNNLKKIGVSKNTNKRIKTLQSSLPDDIQILYVSEELIDKFFYEHFLSKLLYKFRYRNDREFYEINDDDFYNLIKTIETINKLYDTQDKLLQFIKNFDNKYYKRRFKKKDCMYALYKINKVIYFLHFNHIKYYI